MSTITKKSVSIAFVLTFFLLTIPGCGNLTTQGNNPLTQADKEKVLQALAQSLSTYNGKDILDTVDTLNATTSSTNQDNPLQISEWTYSEEYLAPTDKESFDHGIQQYLGRCYSGSNSLTNETFESKMWAWQPPSPTQNVYLADIYMENITTTYNVDLHFLFRVVSGEAEEEDTGYIDKGNGIITYLTGTVLRFTQMTAIEKSFYGWYRYEFILEFDTNNDSHPEIFHGIFLSIYDPLNGIANPYDTAQLYDSKDILYGEVRLYHDGKIEVVVQ